MSEKRFELRKKTVSTNYPMGKIYDNVEKRELYIDEAIRLLNKQDKKIKILEEYVYHCPQDCNKILKLLRKSESNKFEAVNEAMDKDEYFDDEVDCLRSWEW